PQLAECNSAIQQSATLRYKVGGRVRSQPTVLHFFLFPFSFFLEMTSCPGTKVAAMLCRMTPNRVSEGTLRPGRLEMSSLAVALAVSVLFHGGIWGGYKLAKTFGWLQMIHVPAWLHKTKMFADRTDKEKELQRQMEIPLTFVEVNPVAAVA